MSFRRNRLIFDKSALPGTSTGSNAATFAKYSRWQLSKMQVNELRGIFEILMDKVFKLNIFVCYQSIENRYFDLGGLGKFKVGRFTDRKRFITFAEKCFDCRCRRHGKVSRQRGGFTMHH